MDFREIGCGFNYSYFITTDDILYSCGKKALALQTNDLKDGAITKNFGPKVVQFFEGTPIKQIECGQFYVCTITKDNAEAYSWGDNTFK